MREDLVAAMESVPVDDIETLKQTTTALAEVTHQVGEISTAAQKKSVRKIKQMSRFLAAQNSENVTVSDVEESAR